jgi:hypothetical protein
MDSVFKSTRPQYQGSSELENSERKESVAFPNKKIQRNRFKRDINLVLNISN